MRRKFLMGFLSAGIISGVVASASTSLGGRNVIAHTCLRPDPVQNSTTKVITFPVRTTLEGLDTTQQVFLYCPYPDFAGDRKGTVSEVWVAATDRSTTGAISVQACSQPWDGSYVMCGASRSANAVSWTGTTGAFFHLVASDLFYWTSAARLDDYAYLIVGLPPNSTFRGYNAY